MTGAHINQMTGIETSGIGEDERRVRYLFGRTPRTSSGREGIEVITGAASADTRTRPGPGAGRALVALALLVALAIAWLGPVAALTGPSEVGAPAAGPAAGPDRSAPATTIPDAPDPAFGVAPAVEPPEPQPDGPVAAPGVGGGPTDPAPAGVGQRLIVVVPPHDLPTTTPPVTVANPGGPGTAAPGPGELTTTGILPRTGLGELTPRLALLGLVLLDAGWLLLAWARRRRRREGCSALFN